MQARELRRLDRSLEGFLAQLTVGLGRSERRRWAGVYVRGLLLDGERKSIEPMASRLGESDQDLQPFVSLSPWSADGLLEGLAKATAPAAPAYWIIDFDELSQSRQPFGGRATPVLRGAGQDGQLPVGGEPAPRRRGGGHEPTAVLAAGFARELDQRSRPLPARGRPNWNAPPKQAGPSPRPA